MKKFCLAVFLCLAFALQGCRPIVGGNGNDGSLDDGSAASSVDETSADETSEYVRDETSGLQMPESPDDSAQSEYAASEESDDIGYDYAIDISPYLSSINSENLLLVNKQHGLDAGFVPENLTDVTYTRADRDKGKMDATAEKALCAFLEEAYHYGYTDVTVTSAYRSYSSQEWYFNYYIENEMKSGKTREQAEASVLTYSARPGTSEHQTGLCVDVHNLPAADRSFGDTEAGRWMAENAHRFGFILRFPEGKEAVTGYTYEPWHFRFVGIRAAAVIYDEGLCLEEYLLKYGDGAEG